MNKHSIIIEIAENKVLRFETGQVARHANGAVLLTCGDTVLLNTACSSAKPLENVDFLPLRVDYHEKFASAGKTPAGFIKRQGKPSEKEVLTSRLIDRPIRPMFPDGYYHDVQILSYVWSYDGVHSPDVLAICGASAALVLSDIPLIKPVGAVRIGRIGTTFVINPTISEQEQSSLDLVVAGTEDAVLMIEGSAQELTEEEVLQAIELAHQTIRKICHSLTKWQKEHGKQKKLDTIKVHDEVVVASCKNIIQESLFDLVRIREKAKREEALDNLETTLLDQLTSSEASPCFNSLDVKTAYKQLKQTAMREMILSEKMRCDGRGLKDIRTITIEQSFLPRTHGSCLFTRGETQTMAICVLGSDAMAQRYEDLEGEGSQHFYMQYFFPPFSVGEVGRIGPPGRREVGHGKLAERALAAIIPTKEVFAYTIRLESNITESNGSSSMASVCGGCLALMDAGVPIKAPVAGIAMGLILEGHRSAILSDILGIEDALGDMDFKVAGTEAGITALQMDIKIEGITINIMREALAQAKEGRLFILNKMITSCPTHREKVSSFAPRIEKLQIKPSKIGTVIGPGGKQIRAIIEETGVEIDISDTGIVSLAGTNEQGVERAKQIIRDLTAEVEAEQVYDAKITSIVAFGFFCELFPGKEGLCHISEIDHIRIEDIFEYAKEKHIKVGDPITVQVKEVNDKGQIKLSRKALIKRPPRKPMHENANHSN